MLTETVCVFDRSFEDVVNALGFTRLQKYKSIKLWRQLECRYALIYRLEQGMRAYHRENWRTRLNSSSARMRYRAYMACLLRMKRYVAACRSQLDTNNTIDQTPLGDLSFSFLPTMDDYIWLYRVQPMTPLYKHWNQYMLEYPEHVLWEMYADYVEKPVGYYDKAAQLLTRATYDSRRASISARLQWELHSRHAAGWYMVFDTLTLAPDQQARFHENPNSLRDYFRNVGRAVLLAEGRSQLESSADCYSYFCVPEYGSKTDRLHFHCVHFMRTLPKGSRDPNEARRDRTRRQLDSMRGFWSFGFCQPIAIRYSQDAFTRLGWLWPTDKNGQAIPAKPYAAIGFYITKYVCKNVDSMFFDALKRNKNQETLRLKAAQALTPDDMSWLVNHVNIDREVTVYGEKPCQTKIVPTMSQQFRNNYRVRMSRHLGTASLPMQFLSVDGLLQLTKLHYSTTPYALVLKRQALKELANRLSGASISEIQRYVSQRPNLLASLRSTMKTTTGLSQQSSMFTTIASLKNADISDEIHRFLGENRLSAAAVSAERGSSRAKFGSK